MTIISQVGSNNFMAFHTILKNSEDYYTALRRARQLTDSMTERMNIGLGVGDGHRQMHRLHDVLQFFETSLKHRIVKK